MANNCSFPAASDLKRLVHSTDQRRAFSLHPKESLPIIVSIGINIADAHSPPQRVIYRHCRLRPAVPAGAEA